MINILYLAYGSNQMIYTQIYFSIETIWTHHQNFNVHIITDHPEYFEKLSGNIPLKIHSIDSKTINEWMWTGSKNFIFRAKQKAIEFLIDFDPENPLLYLDSDTFIYRPLDNLASALLSGNAIMHECEGLFSKLPTKTEKHIWKRMKNRTIGDISINSTHAMWNAGVIGIPVQNNKKTVVDAIRLSDELNNYIDRNFFLEQASFSIVLSTMYGMIGAKDYIAHYWGNKDGWNEEIKNLYVGFYMQQLDFKSEMDFIRQFNFSKIPFKIRINNTRIRLQKKVNKLFSDKEFFYIQK